MLKTIIKNIIRIFLHIFWILPVKKSTVFFMSFSGDKCACNPYYIFLELIKQSPDLTYIWCCNSDKAKERLKDFDIQTVRYNSISYIMALLTSNVLINNSGFPSWMPFRTKKQIVINTWHGGGAYKRVATSEINTREIINRERLTAKGTSYFVSSCRKFTEVMTKSVLVPENKFVNTGMPRNDIFFNKALVTDTNKQVRKTLGLNDDDYVILYAPTYRGSSLIHSTFDNQIDITGIKRAAEKRYKKNVKLLFRGHVFFTANNTQSFDMDVTSYPEMQELLCMADMLITDYSSSMWDFSFTNKPCLLFCPDIEDYIKNRGFYTDPDKWGFPVCKSNQEISEAIEQFNMDEYLKKIQENHEYFGNYENGSASQSICNLIMEKVSK